MSNPSRLGLKDNIAVTAFDDPNLDEKEVLEFGELWQTFPGLSDRFLTLNN